MNKYPLNIPEEMAFELRTRIIKPFPDNAFKCVVAGSIRRKKPFVGDIDILIGTTDEIVRENASQLIGSKPFIGKISGQYKSIDTQIWFTEPETWSPALLEVTGPRNFNMFLRLRAKQQGLFLSNKGLFKRNLNDTPGNRIDNNTEGNIIWLVLGKRWIPPELRY